MNFLPSITSVTSMFFASVFMVASLAMAGQGGGHLPITVMVISPNMGPVLTQVYLQGHGFSATGNTVHFGAINIINVLSSDGETIQFTVPADVTPGMIYALSVTNGSGETSNEINFSVVAGSLGDFDDSGCTDVSDFLIMLDHWQELYAGQVVGLDDFLALFDHWQTGPNCGQ